MRYEEWQSTYLPIRTNSRTRHGSYFFETYGDDLEFVDSCDKCRVWTLVDTDEGQRIIEGMHYVNRVNYLVTVRPWSEPVEVVL